MKPYQTYLKENQRFEIGLAEAQTVLVKYKIGDGGFGEVWRASHLTQPKNYALKHINIPRLLETQRIAKEEQATLIERLKREASVRVPSEFVVKCYGYRDIEGNFFLLSDFVAGESLRVWIDDHLEMAWPVKKTLFRNILQGVSDLHRAGIVHRDLKPSNILVTLETQIPKIIDFGLAKLDDSALTVTGDFSGSKFYKDPSLVKGWEGIKGGDRASDVYALGILLYELIMGQNPWRANHLPYEEIFNQIAGKDNALDLDRLFQLDAPPQEVDAVKNLIRLSTRFDRSARLQSVDEMLARLGGEAELARLPENPSPTLPEGEGRSPLLRRGAGGEVIERNHQIHKMAVSQPPQPKTRQTSGKLKALTLLLIATGVVAVLWGDAIRQVVTETVLPGISATPTPAPTATPVDTPTPTVSPVAELLRQVQIYLDDSQLTEPPGENALETYQQVLALDPANAEARQGLALMLRTYARWVDGNCLKAEAYSAGFQAVAEYVHDTLRDDALQEEAVRTEQAFLACQSPMLAPRPGEINPGESGGSRRRN